MGARAGGAGGAAGAASGGSARNTKDAFAEVVADYMEHTSLHGYRYLTEPGRHWFERLVWLAVHALATVGVVYQVQAMYREYRTQVPITTVQSSHYHVSLVPFPAVAVCDINKIRKSRAGSLAAKLIDEYGLGGISQAELTGLLRYLGRLYDNRREGEENAIRLQGLLSEYNVSIDYRGAMQALGTQCDELLLACKWAGKARPCSELFQTRKTMEGYCCTFNYVRDSDNFDTRLADVQEHREAEQSLAAGPMMGLTVLVDSNLTDYFYPLLPTTGIKLLVFNPHDYPDTASGGLIEKLVMTRQEVFFTLTSVTTKTTSEVLNLPKSRRNCLFANEKFLFSSVYSYSDCLMECRVNSMKNLCGCVPFFSPVKGKEEDTRVCEIGDLRCLNKHTEMWQTLRPSEALPGLELEMSQSLECTDCFPACGDTVYHVETTSMPLQQVLMDHSSFLKGFAVDNHSVFHIYFGTTSQTLMNKSVRMAWHDLLSNIGGICGVFVGFSAMSLIEFLYFFTLRMLAARRGPRAPHQAALPVAATAAGGGRGGGQSQYPPPPPPPDVLSGRLLLTPSTAPVAFGADARHFHWGRHGDARRPARR